MQYTLYDNDSIVMKFRFIIFWLLNQPYQRLKLTIMKVKRRSCVTILSTYYDANEVQSDSEIDKSETDATVLHEIYWTSQVIYVRTKRKPE